MKHQPTQEEFENLLTTLINHRPITLKEIRELNKINGRSKYPYDEVATKLNNLTPDKLNTIQDIIKEGVDKSWKKVGIKKLYGMIKNKEVKAKIKELYNI